MRMNLGYCRKFKVYNTSQSIQVFNKYHTHIYPQPQVLYGFRHASKQDKPVKGVKRSTTQVSTYQSIQVFNKYQTQVYFEACLRAVKQTIEFKKEKRKVPSGCS